MLIIFDDQRPSDSPYIERVWRSHSQRAGTFQSIAACHWEMVITRHAGTTSLTVRGPETKGTIADCPADGEWFAIRFKLGTFMPLLPPGKLKDRNAVTLPDASGRSFWLDGASWQYPDFETAETFVDRLVRQGLIMLDPMATDLLHRPAPSATARTAERRFLQATGMPQGTARQIERARRATLLLRQGVSILDAVHRTGYYDQAHLTRSLKRFTGQTPGQILSAQQQLSFLYNTTRDATVMV